jgi:rhamnulose-1-phosphate aldolase
VDLSTECPVLFKQLEEMTEVGRFLWEKGWAESNGGNLSADITETVQEPDRFGSDAAPVSLPRAYPNLSLRLFLVTGSGHRFRDFAKSVENNACILKMNESGDAYSVLWGGRSHPDFRPTSEFPTHLRIHDFLRASASTQRIVLHTHPTELIALSHLPDYRTEETINRALWSMLPEVKVIMPRGVGFVPYELPGSELLADATLDALERRHTAVLWEMHGCLATGDDVYQAFDRIDTLNKAAQLIILCRSTGYAPRGLSQRQIDELAKAFKLEG